jgi:hypothetical protein
VWDTSTSSSPCSFSSALILSSYRRLTWHNLIFVLFFCFFFSN